MAAIGPCGGVADNRQFFVYGHRDQPNQRHHRANAGAIRCAVPEKSRAFVKIFRRFGSRHEAIQKLPIIQQTYDLIKSYVPSLNKLLPDLG